MKSKKTLINMPSLALAVIAAIASHSQVSAQVNLTDSDATGENSFTTGLHWSDDQAPTGDKDYYTGSKILRTPTGSGGAVFGGRSLTIAKYGVLAITNTGTITVDDMIMSGGSVRNFVTNATVILDGTITLQATTTSYFQPYEDREIVVNSLITGEGALEAGEGTTTLTNSGNSWAGGITVGRDASASVLQVFSDGALGTGNVYVNASGTLVLSGGTTNDYISETATLYLDNGVLEGAVNLNYDGIDTISGLSYGTEYEVGNGTYDASQLNALLRDAGATVDVFTGSGSLQVIPEPQASSLLFSGILLLGLIALRTRRN